MTLDELTKKYGTGKRDLCDAVIANAPGRPVIQVSRHRHQAPLGDFIRDYILHLQISWWRRGWDWKIVEKHMREQLNAQCVQWWD